MSIRLITTAIIFTALASGCAQTPSKMPSTQAVLSAESPIKNLSKQTIIDQIMADSGLNFTIEQIPVMVAAGFDQQPPPPISHDEAKKFRNQLIQAHDSTKIRQMMLDYFNENYDEKEFTLLLAQLKKPLTKKMIALEKETQNPQAMQEMMQSGNIIMSQTPPKRLELVRTLEAALDAATLTVDMQMMISSAMIINMNNIVPSAQRMTKRHLKQMLEQMRMQATYPTRQFILLNMVYAYRSISDDELSDYTKDAQSETGRWATALMKRAWLEISEEVAIDIAARMEKSFVQDTAL